MTPEQREREYSPSSCIGGDYGPCLRAYAERSAQAREAVANRRELRYGEGERHRIELFLPEARAARSGPPPLLLFIHGGYWQELSVDESLFAAPDCAQHGVAFAAIDYTLAPEASVAGIVRECRGALRWLGARAGELGFDPARLVVAGSSAGAHLAAMCCLRHWPGDPHPIPVAPAGAVLVSGVFDLVPLIGTSINDALGLDTRSAEALSPRRWPLTGFPPVVLAWGEIETHAFKSQSQDFAVALREVATPMQLIESPGRNHFDVILDLARVGSALGDATHRLLRGAP